MIFIFDNFLSDPYKLRDYALKSGLEYFEEEGDIIPIRDLYFLDFSTNTPIQHK